MTAEIAIMNKEAVALAADSAVTLHAEKKIFTSANKIFTLSKYQPVGVMIYGSASFMGIPWETIIKIYRGKLGKKEFGALKGYANDLMSFLNGQHELFPESEQQKYIRGSIYFCFHHIARNIGKKLKEIQGKKDEVSDSEIKKVRAQTIKEHHDMWKDAEHIASIPKDHVNVLARKYKAIIDEARQAVFPEVTKVLSTQLTKIAVNLFVKFLERPAYSGRSGVVIAGFGTEDIFPSVQSFLIEGIVDGYLKHKKDEDNCPEITFENGAAIVAFAQSEMVLTFLKGIEPNYKMAMERDLAQIFGTYPEIIIDKIEKLDEDEKNALKKSLKKIGSEQFTKYKEKLNNYERTNHIDPVLSVVISLPKDELAAMAESLVNLTSFKRKVSMEAETVGGPIDVAVISKGDGFIWIKRKHYFERESNPQFFANYYEEAENGEKR